MGNPLQNALDAIRDLFADMSVSQQETLDRLIQVRDELNEYAAAIEEELEKNHE